MPHAIDPRTPCIIGEGRKTWHLERGHEVEHPEPLVMWEEVARLAAADAGSAGALERLDSLQVVYCHGWQYDDAPARLAVRLGADPKHLHYSGIGGTVPQVLVSDAARRILAGELDLALVVGGEALATLRRMRSEGSEPAWSFPALDARPFPWEWPFHPAELAHEVLQAWLTFALFDNARQGNLGIPTSSHREALGEAMSRLSGVAATNPFAWFRVERSAREIAQPSLANRMVASPYTKLMVAIMDVDMAAGVLLASNETADRLGVPDSQRVYLRGWCYAQDPHYVGERAELWRSPAMRETTSEALRGAAVGVDDVAHLDLYACFPSSIAFAQDALGLCDTDPRVPTVTGGLPYHGGPGSNPVTHSIATMTQVLRADPGSFGLVTGIGMHMSKHVAALYSTTPGPVALPDEKRAQAAADAANARRQIVEHHQGEARVLAGSVVHGRGEVPTWGVLVCETPEGHRCYAKVFEPGICEVLEAGDRTGLVGETVRLHTAPLEEAYASGAARAGTLVNVASFPPGL